MINFDSEQKVFKLDTPKSSYIIGLAEEKYLINLYYGAYIPDANLWANAKRIRSASRLVCSCAEQRIVYCQNAVCA